MQMKDEGVIKYQCNWIPGDPLTPGLISELNSWRNTLYDLKLIGVTEDGIGYGNISIRYRGNEFIISGSGTGCFPRLDERHYALVMQADFESNSISSAGPLPPSSESLTHAMIYRCDKNVNAVIHVHQFELWEQLLANLPHTQKEVSYGTVEMAHEIQRLFSDENLAENRIFAMGGHYTGVIAFGQTLDEAGNLLLEQLKG
jgi:L-ribulose-5-phosphate 4-epimerase